MKTRLSVRWRSTLVAPILVLALLVTGGCGDSGNGGGGGPPPAPTITSFTAARSPVTAGTGTMLTAVFSGGTGTVGNGVGAISSGVPVSTGNLGASTIFLLTVTNAAGATATSTLTVSVVAAPEITEFSASKNLVSTRGPTMLSYIFSGGAGSIDQNIGDVASGETREVNPETTTTYTLTVVNTAGTAVTRSLRVDVVAAPSISSFAAASDVVIPGRSTTLHAVYENGVGTVLRSPPDDFLLGPISSGVSLDTGPLTETSYFKLKVTNAAGDYVSKEIQILVTPFSATGSMGLARRLHTATLLQDGRVLVVGGMTSAPSALRHVWTASCEIYDPSTGTFSFTGSISKELVFHTATRLNDGKVLVVGSAGVPWAEIYDPATGLFSPLAPGSIVGSHTATSLLSGRVLLVSDDGAAEIYDPATGTFSLTGSLSKAMPGHTATRLNDGRILAAGSNFDGSIWVPWAEIYDPATASFAPVASAMIAPRTYHSATLLHDGRVFLAGGDMDSPSYGGKSAELYDPAAGAFTSAGLLEGFGDAETATTLTSGEVLVITCDDPRPNYYDPVTGTLSKKYQPITGEMQTRRCEHTATLLQDGRVLIAGGWTNAIWGRVMADAEIFEE